MRQQSPHNPGLSDQELTHSEPTGRNNQVFFLIMAFWVWLYFTISVNFQMKKELFKNLLIFLIYYNFKNIVISQKFKKIFEKICFHLKIYTDCEI